MKPVFDYLAARILEQGSMSAYVAAIVAGFTPDMPTLARVAIVLAATYKFLVPG